MAQIIRLECTTGGHNKFYEMTENGDGTFTARYGAIGTSGATKTYPMSKWPSIYNEKIRKGYIHLANNQCIKDRQRTAAVQNTVLRRNENYPRHYAHRLPNRIKDRLYRWRRQ